MSAVLLNVIVPDGDLILVMTSDEAWRKQREVDEQREASVSFQFIDFSPGDHRRHTTSRQRDQDIQTGDIRLQVDAKHLMRISKPFRVFLDNKTREGLTLLQDGRLELVLDEDDPEAMCHLMNCIFGRMKEVPGLQSDTDIELDTFVEACVIVDKYDLHEPTCLLLEHWWRIHGPRRPDFNTFEFMNDEFFKWLSIAHILGKKSLVRELMEVYAWRGKGLDEIELLPYPDDLEKVEGRRVHAFGAINQFLERLRLSAGNNGSIQPVCECGDDTAARKCDKAMLESITKILTRAPRRIHRAYQSLPSHPTLPSDAVTMVNPATKVMRVENKKISFNELARHLRQVRFCHGCKQDLERQKKEYQEIENHRRLQRVNIDNLINPEPNNQAGFDLFETWAFPPQLNPGMQSGADDFFNHFDVAAANSFIPPTLPLSWDPFSQQNADFDVQITDWLGSCWQRNPAAPLQQPVPANQIRLPPPVPLSLMQQQHQQQQQTLPTYSAFPSHGHTPVNQPILDGPKPPVAKPCSGPKKTLNKVLDDIKARMLNLSQPFEVINLD